MNSGNLRTIIFIVIGVLILGVFLKVLPYIILGGIAVYLAVKAYNYIKLKLGKTAEKSSSFNYNSNDNIESSSFDSDFDTSNAIEVDYKDVE